MVSDQRDAHVLLGALLLAALGEVAGRGGEGIVLCEVREADGRLRGLTEESGGGGGAGGWEDGAGPQERREASEERGEGWHGGCGCVCVCWKVW